MTDATVGAAAAGIVRSVTINAQNGRSGGEAPLAAEQAVRADPELRELLDQVGERRLDPLSATREIAERVFRGGSE